MNLADESGSRRFCSPNGCFDVVVPHTLVQRMRQICIQAGGVETGGILLGRYRDDLRCASIQSITGPPPDSKKRFSQFFRGVKGLPALLARLWNKPDRTYYLGEWHHHPMSVPDPSPADIYQMNQIANSAQYACPEAILLILSGSPTGNWTVTVNVFKRDGITISLK